MAANFPLPPQVAEPGALRQGVAEILADCGKSGLPSAALYGHLRPANRPLRPVP
jgi:hypothetical protein